MRHGLGAEDPPLPRLVRAGDPSAAPALDDGLGLRRVRDRPREDHESLDAGLPGRAVAATAAEPCRDFASSPSRRGCYESGELAIERSLCVVRDRSMTVVRWTQPGDRPRLTLRVRPAAGLPRSASAPEGDRATGTRRPRSAARRAGCGRCPTCRASSSAASSGRRAWTRPGTGTSATPRRPRGATTPRKTSGARSSGSGRCGPDAQAFALFSLEEVAARRRPSLRHRASAAAGVRVDVGSRLRRAGEPRGSLRGGGPPAHDRSWPASRGWRTGGGRRWSRRRVSRSRTAASAAWRRSSTRSPPSGATG